MTLHPKREATPAEVEARLHVLEGYLAAFLNIDEVIAIIRKEDKPKPVLMKRFRLSDIQADAILDLKARAARSPLALNESFHYAPRNLTDIVNNDGSRITLTSGGNATQQQQQATTTSNNKQQQPATTTTNTDSNQQQ